MTRILVLTLCAGLFAACAHTTKSPDVKDSIRTSLDQAGLKDVSVDQDRDKGVVTLTGHVMADAERVQAEAIAKDHAPGQVVANEIVVTPPGAEAEAKDISEALDNGIEQNLKAALVAKGYKDQVDYRVKAGTVTLTGTVDSQDKRAVIASVASNVPNVREVVNEIQVKGQKATARGGGRR